MNDEIKAVADRLIGLREIMDVSLEVENIEILNKIMNAFKNVESVYEVTRKRG